MRHGDWQDRFWKAMEDARAVHFEWGSHDCVLFAAKMADAISDSGYEDKARSAFAWTDMRSALQLLGNGLQPLVESVLGDMQSWQRLSQGDIALITDDDGRESLAIHDGCQLLGPDEIGYKVIPFRCAKGGWKVA